MRIAYPSSFGDRLLHWGLLLGPPVVLAALSIRLDSKLLAIGAGAAVTGGALFLRGAVAWRPPKAASVALLYLIALGWCWFATRQGTDRWVSAARGGFILCGCLLLVSHDLHQSGAAARRQVKYWCLRIRRRRRWPIQWSEIPQLPEVRALQDIVRDEASPVFDLLTDPRPEVRTAGFAALVGRTHWPIEEVGTVLALAKSTLEPEVRAVAVSALAGAEDAGTVAELGHFLFDPDPRVRYAAIQSSVDADGRRWQFARAGLRAYLASDATAVDGGLPLSRRLSVVAVCDLTAWAAEPEPLGSRATQTLVEYYADRLTGDPSFELTTDLSNQVIDASTPTGLRVELAALLRSHALMTPSMLDHLTNANQPAPLRLLAAETLLCNDPNNSDGLDVLRGLGRLTNRELAVGIAKVLQYRLGENMGLPPEGQMISPKAVAVAVQSVHQWASGKTVGPSHQTPPRTFASLPELMIPSDDRGLRTTLLPLNAAGKRPARGK